MDWSGALVNMMGKGVVSVVMWSGGRRKDARGERTYRTNTKENAVHAERYVVRTTAELLYKRQREQQLKEYQVSANDKRSGYQPTKRNRQLTTHNANKPHTNPAP
jgi:hypothetical protein